MTQYIINWICCKLNSKVITDLAHRWHNYDIQFIIGGLLHCLDLSSIKGRLTTLELLPGLWSILQRSHQVFFIPSSFKLKVKYWLSHHYYILYSNLDCIKVSPPKVRSKQSVISVDLLKIVRQVLDWWKILNIDVGMRRSNLGHICSIVNHWDHIIRKNVEKLFCHIVLESIPKV